MAVITERNHSLVISWLSNYISANPYASTEYKDIMSVLKKEQQYYIRCVIADNKYLYGSYISEARLISMTTIPLGTSC